MGLSRGSLARGSMTLPRIGAHRLVIVAAVLTTVVAAALATALVTFSAQALPRAVRHDLAHASGTTMVITGNVDAGQAAQYTSIPPSRISSALRGAAHRAGGGHRDAGARAAAELDAVRS